MPAVVPRSSTPDDVLQITSPKVATTTVIGMVLGILCLFAMVVSYQLISCPWRKKREAARRVPRYNSTAVITTLNAPSNNSRPFRTCLNILHIRQRSPSHRPHPPSSSEKDTSQTRGSAPKTRLRALYLSVSRRDASPNQAAPISETTQAPTLRERRALRSLRLDTNLSLPRKRYPGTPSPITPSRKRMGRIFQFNVTPPSTPPISPFFSPSTPTGRRSYKRLDDSLYSDWSNEAVYRTERPRDALISPWSPNESQFPYHTPHSPRFTSFCDSPRTPPPLYPPPPAYISENPLRAGSASVPPSPARGTCSAPTRIAPPTPPVSPIVSSLRVEIDGEIGGWEAMQTRAPLVDSGSAVSTSAFVISNDSDEDETPSDLESLSIYTDESIDDLKL